MTPRGEAFLARWSVVERMVLAGTSFFPAMAAGLEDDDWTLVYAAVRRLVIDIQKNDEITRALSSQGGQHD